jgi:hypothetical protein
MEAVSNALKVDEKERDDCDLFGKQVALELRQMSSYSRDMMNHAAHSGLKVRNSHERDGTVRGTISNSAGKTLQHLQPPVPSHQTQWYM